MFESKECIVCPAEYKDLVETDILCQLHTQLELLNSQQRGPELPSNYTKIPCIYTNYTNDSDLLCSLWCSIQEFDDKECINCPEEYLASENKESLCNLHEELVLLQQENGEPNNSTDKTLVACQLEESLCELWCEIQLYDSKQCIVCPEEYKLHVENETLCDLHSQLQLLQQEFGVANIDTTDNTLVSCQYEESESKDILCDLWCAVQAYDDKSCIACPNEYAALVNNQTICDLHQELVLLQQNQTNPIDTSNANLVDCEYKNEQNEDILCNLWCEIQLFNNSKCIECPQDYKNHEENVTLCDLNTELQLLQQTYGSKPEASLDKQPVMCIYEKNIHKDILCSLWCDIQLFSDQRCIDCPERYVNEPESELLCMLNEQLEIAKYPNNIQLTTAPSGGLEPVSCPYKDYTSSSVELCQVWCKLQELSGKTLLNLIKVVNTYNTFFK